MDWSIFLDEVFLIALLAAAIRLAMPVLLATLGEIITELSGILNLGLEGIMTMGAFTGFAVGYATGSVWWGLLAALAAGAIMGAVMSFLSVSLRIDQVVAGLVLVLAGIGLANFLYRQFFGISGSAPRIDPLPPVRIPVLSDLPYVGQILFGQNLFVYLALLLVIAVWFVINHTTWGLKVRATGDVPGAVETVGTSVVRLRYVCTIVGSALAGLGGGFLTAGQLGLYVEGVVAGRGWVALALVIFARWRPGLAVLGALIFGLADAIQFRLQALGPEIIPYEFFIMLPYILTILALLTAGQRLAQPTSLGMPYRKGER